MRYTHTHTHIYIERETGFSGVSDGEESACKAGDPGLIPGSGRSLEKGMVPTLVFLPGKFNGQRILAGYTPWDRKELDTSELLTPPSPYIYVYSVLMILNKQCLRMYQKIACYFCFLTMPTKYTEFIHLTGITSHILCQTIGVLLKQSLGQSMAYPFWVIEGLGSL